MASNFTAPTPPFASLSQQVKGPLNGVRVLDLSRLVAGNMLSLQLADFGADVIKIESNDGDTLRNWKETLPDDSSFDGWWQVYGRNKRSVVVDLRSDDGRRFLTDLARTSQVLIESFRPGTLEKMGLAPDFLLQTNPALVIVRLSGWGQTGPYRGYPGFGSLIEGISGFAVKHTIDDIPRLPNMALADMVSGLTGAFAVMVALRHVEVNNGSGQVIDLSLLDPMLAIMGPDAATYSETGKLPNPTAKIASPRGVFRCRDGKWVALSGSTDSMARRIIQVIGRGELIDNPKFSSNSSRVANDAELSSYIAETIGKLDQAACLDLFQSHGVTVGPIYDIGQLLRDQHVIDRKCFVGGGVGQGPVMHNITPRLSETPGSISRAAPALGEHTAELQHELLAASSTLSEVKEDLYYD